MQQTEAWWAAPSDRQSHNIPTHARGTTPDKTGGSLSLSLLLCSRGAVRYYEGFDDIIENVAGGGDMLAYRAFCARSRSQHLAASLLGLVNTVVRSVGCLAMGNTVAGGVPAAHSPPALLRLRRGKKSAGCPCFLADQASTWEALTLHEKFRPYVLRHLLDEGFICSVLEHGEREHALAACEGVQYYKVGGLLTRIDPLDLARGRTSVMIADCPRVNTKQLLLCMIQVV